jgi:serpin B
MEPMVTGENVAAVLEELESRELRVWLPKFKFETTLPLTDTLKAMGMEVAFDPSRADLTGIAEQGGLFISSVLHKAMIDVNEHGTEAAAATMIAVGATAAEPEPPAEVHVDRPFLFMIHDRETDSVLFMGRVMDPREG